jgi:hypothetical protein
MTKENDIVLIYLDNAPLSFARIEGILPDSKPDWYHVKLLLLQVPLQVVTWILRDAYINGGEFTMNGKHMRLEKIVCPDEAIVSLPETPLIEGSRPKSKSKRGRAKVIPISDFKKTSS